MEYKIRASTRSCAETPHTHTHPSYNVDRWEGSGPRDNALIYFFHSADLSGVLNIVQGVAGGCPPENPNALILFSIYCTGGMVLPPNAFVCMWLVHVCRCIRLCTVYMWVAGVTVWPADTVSAFLSRAPSDWPRSVRHLVLIRAPSCVGGSTAGVCSFSRSHPVGKATYAACCALAQGNVDFCLYVC